MKLFRTPKFLNKQTAEKLFLQLKMTTIALGPTAAGCGYVLWDDYKNFLLPYQKKPVQPEPGRAHPLR